MIIASQVYIKRIGDLLMFGFNDHAVRHSGFSSAPRQRGRHYLAAATRLGDQLILKAKKDIDGVFWETPRDNRWCVSQGLGNGCAGILLFLLRLYQTTSDERYQRIALAGLNRLKRTRRHPTNQSLSDFTGQTAVARVMALASEIFSDHRWLELAFDMSHPKPGLFRRHTTQPHLVASSVLNLLHLYRNYNEPHLRDALHAGADALEAASAAHQDHSGWATIGLALHELAYCLDRPDLILAGDQALDRESNLSAEIGLIYVRIFQLSDSNYHRQRAEATLEVVRRNHQKAERRLDRDFTLCSGEGVTMDLFLQAWRIWRRPEDRDMAESIGDQALMQFRTAGAYCTRGKNRASINSPSLFHGLAGIGYGYLRLYQPQIPSAVCSGQTVPVSSVNQNTHLTAVNLTAAAS